MDCGIPTAVDGQEIIHGDTTYGEMAEVQCKDHYAPSSISKLVCQSEAHSDGTITGKWTGGTQCSRGKNIVSFIALNIPYLIF